MENIINQAGISSAQASYNTMANTAEQQRQIALQKQQEWKDPLNLVGSELLRSGGNNIGKYLAKKTGLKTFEGFGDLVNKKGFTQAFTETLSKAKAEALKKAGGNKTLARTLQAKVEQEFQQKKATLEKTFNKATNSVRSSAEEGANKVSSAVEEGASRASSSFASEAEAVRTRAQRAIDAGKQNLRKAVNKTNGDRGLPKLDEDEEVSTDLQSQLQDKITKGRKSGKYKRKGKRPKKQQDDEPEQTEPEPFQTQPPAEAEEIDPFGRTPAPPKPEISIDDLFDEQGNAIGEGSKDPILEQQEKDDFEQSQRQIKAGIRDVPEAEEDPFKFKRPTSLKDLEARRADVNDQSIYDTRQSSDIKPTFQSDDIDDNPFAFKNIQQQITSRPDYIPPSEQTGGLDPATLSQDAGFQRDSTKISAAKEDDEWAGEDDDMFSKTYHDNLLQQALDRKPQTSEIQTQTEPPPEPQLIKTETQIAEPTQRPQLVKTETQTAEPTQRPQLVKTETQTAEPQEPFQTQPPAEPKGNFESIFGDTEPKNVPDFLQSSQPPAQPQDALRNPPPPEPQVDANVPNQDAVDAAAKATQDAQKASQVGRDVDDAAKVGGDLSKITEGSEVLDENPLGDIVTAGLGIASLVASAFGGGDDKPSFQPTLQSSYQVGVSETGD